MNSSKSGHKDTHYKDIYPHQLMVGANQDEVIAQENGSFLRCAVHLQDASHLELPLAHQLQRPEILNAFLDVLKEIEKERERERG